MSLALRLAVPSEARAQGASAACGTANLVAGKPPIATRDVRGDATLATDGKLAADGAEWDSAAAVTLQTDSGSLTYDLGEPRELSAFFLQADANDNYELQGSLDGSDGSYKLIGSFENVVFRGPGLRERVLRTAATTARFVRVGHGNGDGAYSISEFGAYCQAPAPFPPRLERTATPPAAAVPPPTLTPRPERGVTRTAEGRARSGLSALAAVGGALLIVAWTYVLERTPRRKRGKTERDASTPEPLGRDELALRGLFVASGAAALIYEIVWLHLLRLVVGASALSVALVLGSFMGGMFVGSLFFARFVARARSPLRIYAWLEAGIGVFGLAMPLLLPLAREVYVGLFGYGPLGIAVRALVAVVLLLPPTALMGATLPAVARHVGASQSGMSRLAALYAANTIGAVLGSLLSAFYLLAEGDVWIATFTAVALNFAIAAVATRLSRRAAKQPPVTDDAPPSRAAESVRRDRLVRVVLFATALSGLTALGAQVVWTRLLTLLFGATVYAFAIILSVFLAGLGIGSALAASWLRRGVNAVRALALTQAGLVPALFLGGWLLAEVLPYASPPGGIPARALHLLHVLRAAEVMLPATILWGTSFPLALAALGSGADDAGKSSGFVYAANTGGAILGALGAGFLAIPLLGTHWTEQCLLLFAAISAATLFVARGRIEGFHKEDTSAIWTLGGGTALALLLPAMPIAFLAHGRYIGWSDPRDIFLYVSEGAASTVAVHQAPDGYRHFHVAGRVEASNNPGDLRLERLLGHLSALALPKPKSVLVVGLGGGVTAGALTLHPEIERIVICEIEPRVAGAAAQFAHENYGVLTNPRVELVFDDARHFLATTRERFDVITSDPIHPWVRGNSVLFSQEYYAIVKSRLKPGGIATQWVPLYETSEMAIQIQMRTFMDAFPSGTVWNSSQTKKGYDVVLLGSAAPIKIALADVQQRIDRSLAIQASLRDVRIGSAVDLLGTYGASGNDMKDWLTGVPINRDMSLKLEYISGLALNENRADDIYGKLTAKRTYPEELIVVPAESQRELRRRILEMR